MQSRCLVEAHRLVFSAKLYDHQGPIARGGRTNPPDRPRYEKCPDRAMVNLRPAGGVWTPPCFFRLKQENGGAQRRRVFTYLIPIFLATFVKVSILSHARSGHQVRSYDHTLQKNLQSRPSYSVGGKVMKLSEYDKVIGTYKMFISNFLYRWP